MTGEEADLDRDVGRNGGCGEGEGGEVKVRCGAGNRVATWEGSVDDDGRGSRV